MPGQAPPQGPIPDLRSMEELLQEPTDGVGDANVVPPILANQFELKICLLNQVNAIAFHGFENDDPYSHIRRFTKITQTVKLNNVPSDVVKLLLFLFFLEGPPIFEMKSRYFNKDSIDTFYNSLNQSDQDSLNSTVNVSSASGSSTQDPYVTALTKQGALPSDTVPNPREEIKAITTQSGIVLDGPSVPPPLTFSSSKESPPTLVSSEIPHPHTLSSSELPKRNPRQPPIPYPSRLNKEKLQDNGLLKKLHEKLGDPGRFLIPCDFYGLESCMALADLGASINLMPLSVWKKLSLLDLTPTRMTLELAIRSIAYPAGIAEDVYVQVGKFTFSADFVVNDYDVDLRVPLILGRPFLRTARALVDVHGKELILRDGDEKLIFHADRTSKHPHKHINESINMINFIDITCEDRFPEV
nr:hypothetical protein [Tanacetum cinerariifolium]